MDRPIGAEDPVTTNIFVDKITQTSVDKIDLLFMIDNSGSMSDKQEILRDAVPDLVNRLVDPICVNAAGDQQPAMDGECPDTYSREFNPIEDINIAVVSSSLGDAGAQAACPPNDMFPQFREDRVDMAHTIGSLPRGNFIEDNQFGFLEWRAGGQDLGRFVDNFEDMVQAVGEDGCGWEASLESWYRFLIDPFPYQRLVRVRCPNSTSDALNCVSPATAEDGSLLLDQTLLAQRDEFLRDDSLVAIIMLTDENDCSLQVGDQRWVVANIDDQRPMFRASSTCAENPNDKCCYSCPVGRLAGPPEGCGSLDPACEARPEDSILQDRLSNFEDGRNLRCYQQKKRFGIDFLYPTDRYVNALTQFNLCWSRPDLDPEGCDPNELAPNPLYAGGGRDSSLVFLGGIVGVPYQDIQSTVDANGDDLDPDTELRFKTWDELTAAGDWDIFLGSPGTPYQAGGNGQDEVQGTPPVPPQDTLMIESEFERAGVGVNDINGREYDTAQSGGGGVPDDLQYSCIFPLAEPRVCSDSADGDQVCDCRDGSNDKPLCEEDPGVSAAGTTQYWAKAYPGLRQLQVLRDYGSNSVVASICAKNVTDRNRPDYGYRPAIAAIVDRLKEQLGDRCLPRSLAVDENGGVPCTLVETIPQPDGPCECDPADARRAPDPVVDAQIRGQLAAERGNLCGDDVNCANACLCEVQQVQEVPGQNSEEALRACQYDIDAQAVQGWCYVADTPDQRGLGNPELVANCSATERRLLRFVGQGLRPNTTTFVACTGSSLAARQTPANVE